MTTPGTQGAQADEIADREQVKVIGERLKGLEGLLGPAGLADFLRSIGRGGIDAITGIGGGIVDLIDKATAKAAEVISGDKNIPPSNTKNRDSGLPADLSPIGGGMPTYQPYPKPVNGKCGLGFTPFDLNGDGEPDICIPSVFLPKDEEGDDEQPPSGEDDSPPPTNDSPPPSAPSPGTGNGSPPGGGGPAPGGGTPAPGQEETGRGGQGQPPLMNGECRPPFVPLNLPGGMVLCGLPPNLPDSGDDKKEEKPEDTGGNNQGEDDTDLPDRGPDTGGGGGGGDKEGTPKPDENGVCPPGYFGRDTNGDGINDVCIKIGTGILDLLRMGVGMAGSGPGGRSQTELDKAAEQAGLQVFNDPVNFMRYSPSALQMQDPRYYGITSFVPKGEEPDFNLGYRGVPGQMYANYNVDDKTGALTPRNARNGGIISLAEGGETNFPRKNGQISGPGTERSDDIPAMLSDGEFVVNAKAVRGIGRLFNGKIKDKKNARREGARTMYALQRAGEKAAGLS
tara:strand:+ start:199 stop:1728 length:1530 start_codon:yes stop_codon:yes gene_type:complete